MPAASKHRTISRPATEPWVGGLSTTLLPAMSAGPSLLQAGTTRQGTGAGFSPGGSRQEGLPNLRRPAAQRHGINAAFPAPPT